ncbi:hypothetical protein F511_23401 [Dorcoceras hygrometricum]|uniref:Uncharacterized protein n=1 Tax=Dorcoceras hygrometricum TaxID=472368 RepID=A0A2Z7C3S5_9LAMI|nr:hypothetical protein F511_23401 [Dorcoceras hygrometricum]
MNDALWNLFYRCVVPEMSNAIIGVVIDRVVVSEYHRDVMARGLAYDKFKMMNFVKASVIQNTYGLVRYDDQTSGQLNQKGKAGIGYIRPENSNPSWLKNRLEKDKAKAGSNCSSPAQA